jgi:hypothetical protein
MPDRDTPVLVQVANAKREAERLAILEALRATKWNRRKASVQLQTDYKGLLYKMKVLSIKKEDAAADGLRGSGAVLTGQDRREVGIQVPTEIRPSANNFWGMPGRS